MLDWNGYYLGKVVDWHDAGESVLHVPPEITWPVLIALGCSSDSFAAVPDEIEGWPPNRE